MTCGAGGREGSPAPTAHQAVSISTPSDKTLVTQLQADWERPQRRQPAQESPGEVEVQGLAVPATPSSRYLQ